MKKNIFLAILAIAMIFTLTACEEKKETKQEEKPKINYMVLVNKQNKLPDNYEEIVELETAKDAWGDEVKVEKEALKHFYQLKDDLDNDNIYIELDSIYRSVKEQQELWDRWTVEK